MIVLGGGFGGAYAAQELCRLMKRDAEVVLIDRNDYLLFYPLLVEAGVGAIEPRHAVASVRRFVRDGTFVMGEVERVDLGGQQVYFRPVGSDRTAGLHYDHVVVALGSITKLPPVPGLKEFGFEFKTLADAIVHRDRGIRLLELANTLTDAEHRRALLNILVVGANFTGVELAGEYQAFLTRAARFYPNVQQTDIQVQLIEYSDRILPALDEDLARYALRVLEKRGLVVKTKTTVTEIGQDYAVLTSGERVATHTVVWTAGITPNPAIRDIGLPLNAKGYIECERDLRVKGLPNVWAIGDAATILDASGKSYAATAQNAAREGPLAARNIARTLRGQPTEPFDYKPMGSFAAIGHQVAVANLMGRNVTGMLAFALYRATYLSKMPSFSRKLRLFIDWTLGRLAPLEPVQLGVHRLGASGDEEIQIREADKVIRPPSAALR